MKKLKDYLLNIIANEDLDWIDEMWMNTTFRWLAGNKPSLIEDIEYNQFQNLVNELKEEVSSWG